MFYLTVIYYGHLTGKRDFEKANEFKYVGALITENNEVGKEVKHGFNLGNACYYSVQTSGGHYRIFFTNSIRL